MVTLLEQEKTPKAHRDLAILRLLYDLGLRRAETVSIDVADVNLEATPIIFCTFPQTMPPF